MAVPVCQSQDGNAATTLITLLDGSASFALCDGCLVGWAAAALAVMTGIDPAPFITAVSEDADAAVVDAQEGSAAGWVESGEPPPTSKTSRSGGRTRAGRSSAAPAGRSGSDHE